MDRRHIGATVVLVLAAVLRVLVDRRNPPGVTQDSLVYLDLMPHAPFAPFSPTRPSGYPVVLRLLDALPGSHLDLVTALQHAAGLAVGAMVYLLGVRARVRRGLALAAAALVVIDARVVASEQAVLAETMSTLAVVGSLFLAARRQPSAPAVAASGLLLGVACTMRTVVLFVIPVWLAWLVLGRFGRRVVLAGVAGVVLPVLGYGSMHAAQDAGFSLVSADGWYLYAKVAPVADCDGADIPPETRLLCAGPQARPFEFYLYDPGSPAYTLANAPPGADLEQIVTRENNRLLRSFSIAVIRAHPARFGQEVLADVIRYLGPTGVQNELKLYAEPGTVLAWYERWVHVPWWLVAPTVLAGLVLLFVDRQVALLMGTALALVVGAAATSGFNNRYLIPVLPILAVVGALAADEAVVWWRSRSG